VNVLMVHNRYLHRGGEDTSYECERRLLLHRGHEIHEYVKDNHEVAASRAWKAGLRAIWSSEDYQQLRARIRSIHPNIVHVHNSFPLISPAVYYAAKSEGIPVVQTLHNYRLLCPSAIFFRDGHPCEDCLGKAIPLPGVAHGCYRDSRAMSAVVATMLTTHRAIRTWTRMVDVYVALTQFARDKFIQGGLPGEKIIIKPHFVGPDPGYEKGEGGYALFVGRLSVEKGVDTLLEAWNLLDGKIPLKVVGEGPLEQSVANASGRADNIEYLGQKNASEVAELMGNARLVIVPSECYETFGRVIIEAYAKGTPVIASQIGALAELVMPCRTGLLFRPSDPTDLAEKVRWSYEHPRELAEMRSYAREVYEEKYTSTRNYDMLIAIYEHAVDRVRHHPLGDA